jgi:cytochrome d ubiquinol oxidase subunit I
MAMDLTALLLSRIYIYRLLRAGPAGQLVLPPLAAIPNRPMSVTREPLAPRPHGLTAGE